MDGKMICLHCFFSLRQIQLLCVMTLFIWTEKNVLWINIHHFCIGDIILNFQMISRSEIQHFKLSINEATRMFLYNQIISRTYNPKASRTYTVLFHNLPAKSKMAAFKHQVLQPINLWKRCLPLLNTLSFLPSPSILCVSALESNDKVLECSPHWDFPKCLWWPLTIHRQCSILQLSAAIVFSVLATRSRLRSSRVTVQATRGNLYGSLPYSF